MRSYILAMTWFSLNASGAGFDPPDLGFELRLHQQYIERNQIQSNLPDGRSENYNLQKGETLWSLSEMLYGDGQYWPRVWAQNQGITNPHLVRPGHMLQFKMGSEDETPAFRFSEEGDAGLELVASTSTNPIVEIPPPDVPPRAILKLPASFPEWQQVYKAPQTGEILDDRALGKVFKAGRSRFWLTAYVQESPLAPVGEFLEADGEAGLPLPNQYVYVKLKNGVGSNGEKFLVVKDQGRIKRVNKQWTDDDVAYLVQIYAELELVEEVPAKFRKARDREGFTTYRALVTRSTGLSIKDCVLVEGTMQSVEMNPNGTPGSVSATIIGSEKHKASAVYGPGEIVFLNKGSSDGVEVGQILDVFPDRTSRHKTTPVPYSPVAGGKLRIVKVSDRLATAIVLSARESIMQGDITREAAAAGDYEKLEKAHYGLTKKSENVDDIDSSSGEEDFESELEESESE